MLGKEKKPFLSIYTLLKDLGKMIVIKIPLCLILSIIIWDYKTVARFVDKYGLTFLLVFLCVYLTWGRSEERRVGKEC